MVLGVCRRVTGTPHDAEDAFQAAFLVLARRAAQVSRPELLANWLYGVAYRTALEARAARRRVEEQVVPAAPEPAAPADRPTTPPTSGRSSTRSWRSSRTSTARRSCCATSKGCRARDAAARLGIPEGTLSSRLAHARKVLAERLSRRGVTASAAAIAAALGRDARRDAVPHHLTHTTVPRPCGSRRRGGPAGASRRPFPPSPTEC